LLPFWNGLWSPECQPNLPLQQRLEIRLAEGVFFIE
jgi:hypothetical protein